MKTNPTDIDREAARLFVTAPGMVAWRSINDFCVGPHRVIDVHGDGLHLPAGGPQMQRGGWSWFPVVAFDTDDPATAGVMLAQVEAKKHEILSAGDRTPVDVRWVWSGPHVLGFVVGFEDEILGEGPTRGAALVAAMRFVKEGV